MQSYCSCPRSQLNAVSGFRSDKRNCYVGADATHESVFSEGVGASSLLKGVFFFEEQTVVSGVPSSGQLASVIEAHSQVRLLCAGGV